MFLFLLVSAAEAQFNIGSAAVMGHVRVQVLFSDNGPCDPSTRVELTESTGFTLDESSLNARCVAEFMNVPEGNYHVKAMGGEVASTDNVTLLVSPGMAQEVEVRVKRAGSSETQGFAAAAFVSVSDLGIPANAQKEFEKSNRLISKQDWAKAKERLGKAIAIYPNYAAAYNNLGAVYFYTGDIAQSREALEKAVAMNDHMALAYINLGRVSFKTKDFPGVEAFIGKALSLAAPDAEELTLLASAQLADQHLDQAIGTSRQAHRSRLSHHAYVHVVAAKADEMQGKDDAAVDELKQYLSEEPTGARAERVRTMLAKFQVEPESR
jgi:tetratricopeptide (TPR) repeat protein